MDGITIFLLIYGIFNAVFGCFIGNFCSILAISDEVYDEKEKTICLIFPIPSLYFLFLHDILNIFGKIFVIAVGIIVFLPTYIFTAILSSFIMIIVKAFKKLFVRGDD